MLASFLEPVSFKISSADKSCSLRVSHVRVELVAAHSSTECAMSGLIRFEVEACESPAVGVARHRSGVVENDRAAGRREAMGRRFRSMVRLVSSGVDSRVEGEEVAVYLVRDANSRSIVANDIERDSQRPQPIAI
jgi:hypothetical protein